MKYKYTTKFEAPIYSCVIGDETFISKASLENLKPLIPQDINFSENIDLLGVAFNAAVVNKFNKNDDGMDSETAARVVKNFIHKPTNIEHEKSKIVGHIVSAGFSEYGNDNKMLSVEEIKDRVDPFNISLGAVVYKYANKDFAKLIVGSHEQTHTYQQQIWGVGFFVPYFATGGFWDGKGLNGKHPSFFEVEADRNGHIAYCNKYNKC